METINKHTSIYLHSLIRYGAKTIHIQALIDSGAEVNVLPASVVALLGLPIQKIDSYQEIIGVGGKKVPVRGCTQFQIALGQWVEHIEATVIDEIVGNGTFIILGFPWLLQANPDIAWSSGVIVARSTSGEVVCRLPVAEPELPKRVSKIAWEAGTGVQSPCPPQTGMRGELPRRAPKRKRNIKDC